MDEEDLVEQAETQKLQTSGAFAGLGAANTDHAASDGLMSLFGSSNSTIGVKLLQKMGWKEGQGVGPKVRRKARVDESGVVDRDTHLFAPENSRMITFVKKNDTKGLGFEGELSLAKSSALATPSGDSDDDTSPFKRLSIGRSKATAERKGHKKTGFGVGILNDTGSDEEDPYEIGPRISYNRVIGEKKPKKKAARASLPNPLLASRPVFISKKESERKAASGFRKCHDGKLPLEGFILSTSTDTTGGSIYSIPEIPEGWQSAKKSSTGENQTKPFQSTADAAKASTLDPKARAALLGEAALPGKSVYDFLSPAARNRIATASGKQNLPAALNEAPPEAFRKSEAQKAKDVWNMVPELDKELAAAALSRGVSGWMPYAEDEPKRDRYRSFLTLRAGLSDKLPDRAPQTTVEEWVREMQEFAHAARVFKPMTGMMASRFTSSSTTMGSTSSDAPLISKPEPKPEDPAEAAAKMGMYGPMTRSIHEFFPTRLVCKRFNVKPPSHVTIDPGAAPGDVAPGEADRQRLEIVSKSAIDEMLSHARFSSGGFEGGTEEKSSGTSTYVRPSEELVDVERNEALEGERPGDAVFKAIFGSDTDDDD